MLFIIKIAVKNNWFPQIMDRTTFFSFEESEKKNIYIRGHERVEKLLLSGDFWEIDRDGAKEIDAVVEKAGNIL